MILSMNIYKRILISVAITYVIGFVTWYVVYWGDTTYQPTFAQHLVLPFFLAAGMPIVAIIVLILAFCTVSAFTLQSRNRKSHALQK